MFQIRAVWQSSFTIGICLLGCSSCSADEDFNSLLTRLVTNSSLVALVSVVEISDRPVLKDPFGDLYLASVRPSEVLVDRNVLSIYRGESIELLFRQAQSHSPNFSAGQRKLVFVAFCENGPLIVGGVDGSITQESASSEIVQAPLGHTIGLTELKRLIEAIDTGRSKNLESAATVCD